MSLGGIPHEITNAIRDVHGVASTSFRPVGGGCINNGGRLDTPGGAFFVKWNNADRFPDMFLKERLGLELLAQSPGPRVPSVFGCGVSGSYQYIALEWIEPGRRSKKYWEELGRALAGLHRTSAALFGLDHDNFIGSLPQVNTPAMSWCEFFVTRRLEPQLQLLEITPQQHAMLGRFFRNLPEIMPEDKPALLHGDLWSGNVLADEHGGPVLIDPAVYFGHREAELAFSKLFGGFEAGFYDAYQETFPLHPGHHERVGIFNIYPLLVHANLFGGSYLSQAFGIIERWA